MESFSALAVEEAHILIAMLSSLRALCWQLGFGRVNEKWSCYHIVLVFIISYEWCKMKASSLELNSETKCATAIFKFTCTIYILVR